MDRPEEVHPDLWDRIDDKTKRFLVSHVERKNKMYTKMLEILRKQKTQQHQRLTK